MATGDDPNLPGDRVGRLALNDWTIMNTRKHDKVQSWPAPPDPMPVIENILWPDSWLTPDEAKAARNA